MKDTMKKVYTKMIKVMKVILYYVMTSFTIYGIAEIASEYDWDDLFAIIVIAVFIDILNKMTNNNNK